ncbi:hypothetical protein MLD38_014784 [Melastoma candidum]|uniref:Uncharacterized protein n=1 Tax=Melastoma candidum TaxID=119954 RepID=A0ACB9RDU6_9MYRT|nr:hypothetical protein MLD38_014784 [Melastoma candidum]
MARARPHVGGVVVAFILPLLFSSVAAQLSLFPFAHGLLEGLFGGRRPPLEVGGGYGVPVMDGNDGGLTGDVGTETDVNDSEDVPEVGGPPQGQGEFPKDRNVRTNFAGNWELVSRSSGVSAMHMQLMPNNKALIFDSTAFGPSQIKLDPRKACVKRKFQKKWIDDCTAHAVVYDIENAALRPLFINTDPWCSSGGLGPDGTLVSTGGWDKGAQSVRFLKPCDSCDWQDTPSVLGAARWYATQIMLPDGNFVVVGGRRSYSYEYVPVSGKVNKQAIPFKFLDETTDLDENNLYPFVYLLPDGTLFVFANSRSVILDLKTNKVVKEFPRLKGGSRNYPASGMSALLPLKMPVDGGENGIRAEVIVCGGNKAKAYRMVDKNSTFLPALMDCGRIVVTEQNAEWQRESMPSRRVMGDLLILPTGDLLILNGAKKGTSAWNFAEDPNFIPALYSPDKPVGTRFRELTASTIPRMYHSSAIVLPDGKILVGGSNTNSGYFFKAGGAVKYPTELRMQKFSPPYLDPALAQYRPHLMDISGNKKLTYRNYFNIKFTVGAVKTTVDKLDVKVTLYTPPFTTHGYSMNQRLLVLAISQVNKEGLMHNLQVKTPAAPEIAPPGYYLAFVVYKGVPSVGAWVHLQ